MNFQKSNKEKELKRKIQNQYRKILEEQINKKHVNTELNKSYNYMFSDKNNYNVQNIKNNKDILICGEYINYNNDLVLNNYATTNNNTGISTLNNNNISNSNYKNKLSYHLLQQQLKKENSSYGIVNTNKISEDKYYIENSRSTNKENSNNIKFKEITKNNINCENNHDNPYNNKTTDSNIKEIEKLRKLKYKEDLLKQIEFDKKRKLDEKLKIKKEEEKFMLICNNLDKNINSNNAKYVEQTTLNTQQNIDINLNNASKSKKNIQTNDLNNTHLNIKTHYKDNVESFKIENIISCTKSIEKSSFSITNINNNDKFKPLNNSILNQKLDSNIGINNDSNFDNNKLYYKTNMPINYHNNNNLNVLISENTYNNKNLALMYNNLIINNNEMDNIDNKRNSNIDNNLTSKTQALQFYRNLTSRIRNKNNKNMIENLNSSSDNLKYTYDNYCNINDIVDANYRCLPKQINSNYDNLHNIKDKNKLLLNNLNYVSKYENVNTYRSNSLLENTVVENEDTNLDNKLISDTKFLQIENSVIDINSVDSNNDLYKSWINKNIKINEAIDCNIKNSSNWDLNNLNITNNVNKLKELNKSNNLLNINNKENKNTAVNYKDFNNSSKNIYNNKKIFKEKTQNNDNKNSIINNLKENLISKPINKKSNIILHSKNTIRYDNLDLVNNNLANLDSNNQFIKYNLSKKLDNQYIYDSLDVSKDNNIIELKINKRSSNESYCKATCDNDKEDRKNKDSISSSNTDYDVFYNSKKSNILIDSSGSSILKEDIIDEMDKVNESIKINNILKISKEFNNNVITEIDDKKNKLKNKEIGKI